MSKPMKKHRAPPAIDCAACQGFGIVADEVCIFCEGRGIMPALKLLPAARTTQADPTSIIFRGKAYDVLTQDNARIPYFFLGKRIRYVLVRKPESTKPIFMIMSDGSMKVHACYRLTPAGQLVETR